MRAKKSVAMLAMCLAATMSIGLVGCKDDDEPTPEIVIDNPLDKEVYYIIGKATDGSGALQGVEVSTSGQSATTAADGTFALQVTQKGTYALNFTKQGYVAVSAKAVVASNATKQSSVSVLQTLTQTATPVTVTPAEDAVVSDSRSDVTELSIPAGAVTQNTAITVTEYVKGADASATFSSLSTISCTPDGQKFEKSVEVAVKNATSSAISFANVKHFVEQADHSWKDAGAAAFNAERNLYLCDIDGFSNHSFGPASSASDKGTSKELLSSVTIDNLGKMAIAEQAVVGKQKIGWEVKGNLRQTLGGTFSGLGSSDLDALSAVVGILVASTKGSAAGVQELPFSLGNVKVDGDQKVTISMYANVKTTSFTVSFNYNGSVVAFSVDIATYEGVSTTIEKVGGSSHPGHSGGSAG
jgi:hypothetical protein